jgi:hypothetical protein
MQHWSVNLKEVKQIRVQDIRFTSNSLLIFMSRMLVIPSLLLIIAILGFAYLAFMLLTEPQQIGRTYCTGEDRLVDACIEIYQPVCGWFDTGKIRCVTYPCAITFSNSCFACQDENVAYWTEGECPSPG